VQQVSSGPNSDYTIHYRDCNQISACFLLPPPGQLTPPPPTIYAATTNWFLGNPILVNNNLFWTESDQKPLDHPGDVKRKGTSDPTAPGAETIAIAQANIDRLLYVANDQLYFARRGAGIYSLPLNASAITRDFKAEGVEVTQGIQNLANSTPLVAKKTTYVRAYATQLSGPSAPVVEARLVGIKNDLPLPGSPLKPVNGVRALTTGGGYDRAKLNDGWYFLLPASWTEAGPITLQVEIDPRQMHTDPNRADNALSQPLTFQAQPPVCVMTVPVRTHTPRPSTKDPNFAAMVSQFDRRWPVPETWIFRDTDPVEELEVCWWGPFPHPCHGPYELEDGWGITNGMPDRDKVIVSLWGRALLSFNPDACDSIGAPVHFMGLVHPDANNGGASGYASTVSSQSWVQLPDHLPNPLPATWNAMREGSTMAQELAHNHGRKHVDCGGPDNIDTGYPYPPCQIAEIGADSYYGFDVASLQPIRPNQTADFMSYSFRSWVSDYTWRSLIGAFATTHVAADGSHLDAGATEQGNSVFVTGMVDSANHRGEISLMLVLPTASVPPATRQTLRVQAAGPHHDDEPHADYKLRLFDPNGALLVERTLTLTALDDHTDESNAALFSDLFAQPAGQVATIQLLSGDSVIDSLSPGTASPTVSIQQPAGGETIDNTLTIQWTASDPDPADRLLFTVQYSHDNGASWHTLALDQPSTPDPNNSLSLSDLGSLHGSGPNSALVRVLASDGYNTAIATSQPFTLANRPPEPVIFAPGQGQTFAAGPAVVLQGSATDAEDGGLGEFDLDWQVDGIEQDSGPAVSAAGLGGGAHTATLAATDSVSQTVTATVSFNVAPLSVPLAAAPLLDGFCEDEVYVQGASLLLKPYTDGTQANLRLLRSEEHLWACFSGLQKREAGEEANVALYADIDNSRDPLAQPTDAGFFAGENGDVSTAQGDNGGFIAPGPEGFQAQVSAGASSWSAELRIDKAALGGWEHLVGLSFAHHWAAQPDEAYPWPYTAAYGRPTTWSTAALGMQPVIAALEPFTATMLGPSFTLTVAGSGFVSGTTVLWNGSELPTTYVDGEQLTAQVGAAQLSSATVAQVKTRSPAPAGFESNEAPFVVQTLAPAITALSPISVVAGGPAIELTVDGSSFAPDAQILWNGEPLNTQFVSPTQLRAQVNAALLANGQIAGVAVRNPLPDARISPAVPFEVTVNPSSPENGSVAGMVFADANGNGQQEAGEPGVPGAQLTLSGETAVAGVTLVRTASSGSDGSYRFFNVPPGSYTLVMAPPAGYQVAGPRQHPVTVSAGSTATAPSFVVQPTSGGSDKLYLPTLVR
jgi:hypothetical protein